MLPSPLLFIVCQPTDAVVESYLRINIPCKPSSEVVYCKGNVAYGITNGLMQQTVNMGNVLSLYSLPKNDKLTQMMHSGYIFFCLGIFQF